MNNLSAENINLFPEAKKMMSWYNNPMNKKKLTYYLTNKSPKERVMLILFLMLALFIIIMLSITIWRWQLDWRLSHQKPLLKLQHAQLNQESTPKHELSSEHLFGQSDVPVTDLSYKVTGTVKVDNGSGKSVSKAYISIDGENSKIFEIGDIISNDVSVYGITPNEVILKNHGKLEKLPLPRMNLEFKPVTKEEIE